MSSYRLFTIKDEGSGAFSVNSAGFKTSFPTISEAAKAVGVNWQLVADAAERNKATKVVIVSKSSEGKFNVY